MYAHTHTHIYNVYSYINAAVESYRTFPVFSRGPESCVAAGEQ